jgi:hypothetical protein
MKEAPRRTLAAWATLLLLQTSPAAALQDGALPERAERQASPSKGDVLEVPYLPQSEALCGGAAVAMVMRYWGERDIYAEDFAGYVSDEERGISTESLARAVERSGWSSIAFNAGSDDVVHHLSRGRPLIALIEVASGQFHYVVIVGRNGEGVLYHDPAVGPYREMSTERFERAWSESGHWVMLLLRDAQRAQDQNAAVPAARKTGRVGSRPSGAGERAIGESHGEAACDALVTRAIESAASGDLQVAERLLVRANEACGGSPTVIRELAGLRFRQQRFAEAVRLAERSVALDPDDAYGWELLAAARFRAGEHEAALAAWNRIGAPRVDVVDIRGLRRTRYPLVAARLGIGPRDTLTPAVLRRSQRRAAALPTVSASAVRYRPLPDGSVKVEAAVVERPVLPTGLPQVIGTVARALPTRELSLSLASPVGAGALLGARWRWWENRPLVGVSIAAPGALALPGVLEMGGYWERQSYERSQAAVAQDDPLIVEERRHAALWLDEWLSGALWLNGGLGVDRFADGPIRPGLRTAAQLRVADDRLALLASGSAWPSHANRSSFGLIELGASWRSASSRRTLEWRARSGLELATAGSPLALWRGAGTGHARDALLRAHPLLDDGVVRGERIGRYLAHGGVEVTRWLSEGGLGAAGVALFVDGAKLWRPLDGSGEARLMIDPGAGARFALPGQGRLRADLAVGLRDGAMAMSMAWEAPWPVQGLSQPRD